MTPYAELTTTLPQLTPTQLKDLSNRCKALLSRTDEVIDNDWLFEGILTELRLQAIPVPPISKIKASNIYTSYAEKSRTVRDMLEAQGHWTRLQKRQLSKISTKCLIDYLHGFTEISLANVLTYIDRVPLALERSFPGYLASNLLFCIIRNPIENA